MQLAQAAEWKQLAAAAARDEEQWAARQRSRAAAARRDELEPADDPKRFERAAAAAGIGDVRKAKRTLTNAKLLPPDVSTFEKVQALFPPASPEARAFAPAAPVQRGQQCQVRALRARG